MWLNSYIYIYIVAFIYTSFHRRLKLYKTLYIKLFAQFRSSEFRVPSSGVLEFGVRSSEFSSEFRVPSSEEFRSSELEFRVPREFGVLGVLFLLKLITSGVPNNVREFGVPEWSSEFGVPEFRVPSSEFGVRSYFFFFWTPRIFFIISFLG